MSQLSPKNNAIRDINEDFEMPIILIIYLLEHELERDVLFCLRPI